MLLFICTSFVCFRLSVKWSVQAISYSWRLFIHYVCPYSVGFYCLYIHACPSLMLFSHVLFIAYACPLFCWFYCLYIHACPYFVGALSLPLLCYVGFYCLMPIMSVSIGFLWFLLPMYTCIYILLVPYPCPYSVLLFLWFSLVSIAYVYMHTHTHLEVHMCWWWA